jgi:hypothetical protein
VLPRINEVKILDHLILEGYKDIDFPYTEATVPQTMKESGAQRDFLHTQRFVLSERLIDLLRGGRYPHMGGSI